MRMAATILGSGRDGTPITRTLCEPGGRNGGRAMLVVHAMALRLDPVITAMYVVTLAAPVAAYAAIRLARRGEHDMHRIVQSVLLVMGWVALLSLEMRIRL